MEPNREYRSLAYEFDVKRSEDNPEQRTMFGYFSTTETPYFVRDFDGEYIETISRGAFVRTLKENKDKIKIMLDHGRNTVVGNRPLGKLTKAGEDSRGGFYEVELLDTSYVRDLVPALEKGLYGASFTFRVLSDEWDFEPKRSKDNPDGLPERRITDVDIGEFGPVLFPANDTATASVRSLMNENEFEQRLTEKHEDQDNDEETVVREQGVPPVQDEVDESRGSEIDESKNTKVEERNMDVDKTDPTVDQRITVEERRARIDDIKARLQEIDQEFIGSVVPDESRSEWDGLIEEHDEHVRAITAAEERRSQLERLAKTKSVERGTAQTGSRGPAVHIEQENIFDLAAVRQSSRSDDEYSRKIYDNARRVAEMAHYDGSRSNKEEYMSNVHSLLATRDDANKSLARRVINTGSPEYRAAYAKWMAFGGQMHMLNQSEQRAMALGADPQGGFGVPFELDSTIILTSDGVINPLRDICRVERITGKELQLVTSDGVTVTRDGEAQEVVDGSPTLAQPTFNADRVSAYVPFSIELDAGYDGLRGQLTNAIAERKLEEEAEAFVNGTTNIIGINQLSVNGANVVNLATAGTFTADDLFNLEESLAPRYRVNGKFVANHTAYNDVRQFGDTDGYALWERLGPGLPTRLLGHETYELSTMASTATATDPLMVFGDWRRYVIVDRIGMVTDFDPIVVGPNARPTGERALVAFWWNGGGPVNGSAFSVLTDGGS